MLFPKISIITPTFNQVDYIEQTILSVINQDYPNIEYIIIDGGSTDGTVEIIKKYENRINYWISEKDNGLYDAINKGFKIANGEILAWLNSDDIYLPKALFTVAEIFSSFHEVNWLQGANSHIDEKGRLVSVYQSRYWTKFDFSSGNMKSIQQESTFFRSSLWINSGQQIDVNSQLAGDYSLWLTFFEFSDLHITTAPLGCFRMRSSNQKSLNQRVNYENEKKEVYRRHIRNNGFQLKRFCYKVLYKFKIFDGLNLVKLEIKIKQLFFKGPKIIKFNRLKQKFELVNK